MSTYIRGNSSNFGNINEVDVTLPTVQVDEAGQTLFVAYHYRKTTNSSISTPTWNGESFTELVNRGNLPGDDQHVMQVFMLTTASAGTFPIIATNNDSVANAAVWALYSGVTTSTPIELEEQWAASGYSAPSLTVTGDGTILSFLGAANYAEGFSDVTATTWTAADDETIRQSIQNNMATGGWAILAEDTSVGSETVGFTPSASQPAYVHVAILIGGAPSIPSFRKTGTFTVETTLSGTVISATLNGQAITVDSQAGTTVTLTDSDGSITTSGEYALVLTDDSADPDETITVQVNVYGVAPSNNPLQKDGAALASLTGVEIRISAGATLEGSQLFYTATATTDASGNLGNIDLSATAAADTDPVLLSIRTAAGDSIIAAETVELI